jgi:hypothetical protein
MSTLSEDEYSIKGPLVELWRILQEAGGGKGGETLDKSAASYCVKDEGIDACASYGFIKALLASCTYLYTY